LQTDPSGFDGGFNLYAYAGNDPVNQEDPTGLSPDGGGYTIKLSETIATTCGAVLGIPSLTVAATATYDEVTVAYYPDAAGGQGHVGIGIDTDNTQGFYPANRFYSWFSPVLNVPGEDVPRVVESIQRRLG
jgi:hypothetical protein